MADTKSRGFFSESKAEKDAKKERKKIRESKGIRVEDVGENADLLMKLLERCYSFGDPTFNPDIIYRQAAEEYGFEPNYVSYKLISNLVKRKIVSFEYSDDKSLHPKDRLDYWRLNKNT